MAYTKSQLSQMSTSAQYIADENAKLAQSPKCFIIPPQFYVQLNATFVDLPLIINVQACNVYCNVNTGPGTAAGKFTPIIKGQRMIEWPVGITQAILHVDLAGTGVEGTYFDVTLSDIQPPKMPVPEYSNVTFRVYFSAVRSAGIPLSYQKVWETDFVTSYSDVSLLGCDPVTGNPTLRGMVNQERWQFGGDDVIFMMPNEVCVGQTNGCGADPWRTRTDPVTGTGTVRALRTEWVPNTANGGASLRVIDGHGNDSSTQTRVPVINNTHRSGGQFCTMTTMVYRWGYLECETWQPYTGGTWMTAFWLLPIYNDAGTTLYEIDVGENRVPDWQQSQTDAGFAYHFYNYADRRAYKVLNAALRGIVLPLGNNLYNRWIRYGLLWDVDKIAFYIDGQKVAECPNLISSDFMHVIQRQLPRRGDPVPEDGAVAVGRSSRQAVAVEERGAAGLPLWLPLGPRDDLTAIRHLQCRPDLHDLPGQRSQRGGPELHGADGRQLRHQPEEVCGGGCRLRPVHRLPSGRDADDERLVWLLVDPARGAAVPGWTDP
jgi:hypothetical protein